MRKGEKPDDPRVVSFDNFLVNNLFDWNWSRSGSGLDLGNWQVPVTIAFAHFDCGYDDDTPKQRDTIHLLLGNIYDRMPAGAIGALMDCYDPGICQGHNFHAGVFIAATEFFADKPEKIVSLWGGDYAHAYFRKLRASARAAVARDAHESGEDFPARHERSTQGS